MANWKSFLPTSRRKSAEKLASGAPGNSLPSQPSTESLQQEAEDTRQLGLENFGNTCYCNAVLQALYSCRPFRDRIFTAGTHNLTAMTELLSLRASQMSIHASDSSLVDETDDRSRTSLNSGTAQTAAVRSTPSLQSSPKLQPTSNQLTVPATGSTPPSSYRLSTLMRSASREQHESQISAHSLPKSPSSASLTVSPAGGSELVDAEKADETMLRALKELFVTIHNQRKRQSFISPKNFVQHLRRSNEMFRASIQHDAHEFLNYLLNDIADTLSHQQKQLHKLFSLNQLTDQKVFNSNSNETLSISPLLRASEIDTPSTWIHELFEGKLVNEIKCLYCETVTNRTEPFLDLSLDIPSDYCSLLSCIRNFSKPELLKGGNKFHCDECGELREAEKRMKIQEAPRLLALHLKRFKYVESLQRHVKLTHRVSFPMDMYLPVESMALDEEQHRTHESPLYQLIAVVVHIGSTPSHGHYICVAKKAEKWWLFDDDTVEHFEVASLSAFFGTGGIDEEPVVSTRSHPQELTEQQKELQKNALDTQTKVIQSIMGTGYGWMPGHFPAKVFSSDNVSSWRRQREGHGYILLYEAIKA